jgi:MoaA/NifB/PqqE/SkfB family radical SAM enzyme
MKRGQEFWGYLNSKFRGRPFFALYRLTRACNLRCRMCNVWRGRDTGGELNLEQIRRVARILKQLKLPYVVLTGGDPFLRRDVIEIIRIFSRQGFHTRIESNGGPQVTRKLLDQAVAAGIIDYSTSLDTLDKEKQDRLCRGQGVWQQTVDTLRYAINRFPGLLPHVNIVVSHHNLEELPRLVRFIDGLGAYCTLAPVVLGDERESSLFKGFDPSFAFTERDKQLAPSIYEQLIELKEQGYKLLDSTKFLRDSVEWIKTGKVKWTCDGGQLYLEIFPDGGVGICNEISYGANILDGDFIRQFGTREYKNKLKRLRAGCPGCTYPVFREPSYHFRYYSVLWERIRGFLKETSKWD